MTFSSIAIVSQLAGSDARAHIQAVYARGWTAVGLLADGLYATNMFIGVTSSGDNVNSHYDYLI